MTLSEVARIDASDKSRLALLASIVQSSEDAIISTTLDGVITFWNPAAERMYGYLSDEVIGQPISMLVPLEKVGEEVGMLKLISEGQSVEHFETVRVRKDGSHLPISLTVSPVHDHAGVVVGASSSGRDITERVKAEEEIRVASEYARSLIEANVDPMVTIGPNGKTTDVNEATVAVTGWPRETLIGTEFSDFFTEPEQAREGYRQVFEEGSITAFPLTIRQRDGGLRDVLYNASVYRDASGNVLGVLASARDVTAQKRASEYARSLIEAAVDPLVTIGPDGKITDLNEATVAVTGWPRETLIGTEFSDYFTEPEPARAAYQQVFTEGSVTGYPLTIRQRDGGLCDVLYNASVYRDATGNVLGVFASARDITAQKRASEYARSLIEANIDPLVTISPDGKITDVNEATVAVTGWPRETLIGTYFTDYFTEPEQAREGYQQVFAEGSVTDFPLTIRHRDGVLRDVLYNSSLYRDITGNVLGVFASARDVTAQKRAESLIAEQRGKELERMAELERFQTLIVGRELKMIELKKEIAELTKLVKVPENEL